MDDFRNWMFTRVAVTRLDLFLYLNAGLALGWLAL